jgi:hypothetical protein
VAFGVEEHEAQVVEEGAKTNFPCAWGGRVAGYANDDGHSKANKAVYRDTNYLTN